MGTLRLRAHAQLALLLLSLVLWAGKATAQAPRESVRILVSNHMGKPTAVSLVLINNARHERLLVEANEYGLAFATLLPNVPYTIATDGFTNLGQITVPSKNNGDYTYYLKLPKPQLKNLNATPGKGLVQFTYINKLGKPEKNISLKATSNSGHTYTAKTNDQGTCQLTLPLNSSYTFSAGAYSNFTTHTFAALPAFQTATITLEEAKEMARRKKLAEATAQAKKDISAPAKRPTMRNHRDSVTGARNALQSTLRGSVQLSYSIPPRSKNHGPKVSKQVVNGVYLLRQALLEEQRKNPLLLDNPHLAIIPPLMRNKWDSIVLVIDITCSMDPYIEEYLLWSTLANNHKRTLGSVFFNDGDGCADSLKQLGHTGGIRHAAPNLRSMVDTMLVGVSFGCSGDAAENDAEALLYAQTMFPEARSIVLIADNSSAVRDLELAALLHKPVHILLCDTRPHPEPNPDYVTIAFLTNGSLHLLGEDLEVRKKNLNDNDLLLGRWAYKWTKDHFTR